MRIYLDNCSFNRPFDGQDQVRVRLEAEAKLFIQRQIRSGKLELAWSYMLEFENSENPFDERRSAILVWRNFAVITTGATPEIVATARALQETGVKSKDALHLACAIALKCGYFITTDDRLLRKTQMLTEITVTDPLSFVREVE